MSTAKDLSKEAPASARTRVGNYVILARMADKARASTAGTLGEFHFDCPLDNMLFGFKNVKGPDVKAVIDQGADNEAVAAWLDANGDPKTEEEKTEWSNLIEAYRPYDNPEKKEWFIGVCEEAGCDPATSTLFDFLDADDRLIGKTA